MDVTELSLDVGGGRSLDVRTAGPEDGVVLFAHHGTPSTGRPFRPYVEAAAERGLRLVTYSRPGYAGSTRMPGRSVADCATDTARIADHLGAERFYTIGQSGGGPHTLACAALLPDRVISCATTAGVGPWDADGLDFLAGMAQENVEEMTAALDSDDALQRFLELQAANLAQATPADLADALGGLVSPVDVAALTGEFAEHATAMLHQAISTGIWGWFDDDIAFVHPWGFELADIRVPVTVWQGAQDRMVPFAHGEWLAAHVAGAKARLLDDEGHLSLIVGSFPMILDDLMAVSEV
ncbi:MAG: alpha/beta fold hydrolase [Actinomycetota bacterium]